MNIDTRGFMDGAFRGFQMMESYYDRQDRKEERADSLRRADERHNAQITRQNERQQIEDQRYEDKLQRDKEHREEEVSWRKQVHEDNKALKSLRYATSGKKSGSSNGDHGFGKEYRGAVTKLMTWKRDALSKLNPVNYEKGGYEAAVSSIEEQYQSGMKDINSLYGLSDVDIGGNPPPKDEAPYISWTAKDPNRAGFINALKRANIDVSSIPADKLTLMFNDNAAKKAESEAALARKAQFDSDADKILGLSSAHDELAVNAYRAR
ncbi:hypothetical protein ACN08N_23465 [Photobacterium leiognathi subsp. mandapamensis]|uniref:hypothetical protein n=1 Tax=Photobacterium leiognathi TaxID=553611 RepID=UPI003AF3D4B1